MLVPTDDIEHVATPLLQILAAAATLSLTTHSTRVAGVHVYCNTGCGYGMIDGVIFMCVVAQIVNYRNP